MTKFEVTMHQVDVTVVHVEAESKIAAKQAALRGEGEVFRNYIDASLEKCHSVEELLLTGLEELAELDKLAVMYQDEEGN